MKWIEIDSKRIKYIVKSVKGITLESLSKEMGHGRSFLSDACGRGRMNATDLKLLSMLLNVPQKDRGSEACRANTSADNGWITLLQI